MAYKDWIEKEIEFAKERELDDSDDIMNSYIEKCIDSAKELALLFSNQNHTGMSANITLTMFNRLAKREPMTPITGEDDEWNFITDINENLYQSNRDSKLFKRRDSDKEDWKYTYNDILKITNDDDIWKNYPPLDDPGTLDDDIPEVKEYFDKRHDLRNKLNSTITFPFKPKTYVYYWDFDKHEFSEYNNEDSSNRD